MNSLVTKKVWQHIAAQVAAAALTGAIVAVSHVDFSALGNFAPLVVATVQGLAATLTAVAHDFDK